MMRGVLAGWQRTARLIGSIRPRLQQCVHRSERRALHACLVEWRYLASKAAMLRRAHAMQLQSAKRVVARYGF